MRSLLLISFLMLSLSVDRLMAQSGNTSSDFASLPYNVSEMEAVIGDAITEPTEQNAYVKIVLDDPSFPGQEPGSNPDKVIDREAIRKWVIEHPDKIELLLIARKKNFDKYFNPALKSN